MGQGYRAIILASQEVQGREIVRTWVDSHAHGNGYKLMEHSYVGNQFVEALEQLISPVGMFYKSRVVWAGDYADSEAGLPDNLYTITEGEVDAGKVSCPSRHDMSDYKYVVNHTAMQYVVKTKDRPFAVHPLPLLTAEGNGRGGGDYSGPGVELVGTWARATISVEKEIPIGYTELVCGFT